MPARLIDAQGRGSSWDAWTLPVAKSSRWHTPLLRLGAALVVAALLSTEFLAQPFIWRYFASDEIVSGWLLVMRDRLLVAVAIALSLSLLDVTVGSRRGLGPGLIGLAIILGAGVSEAALLVIDPQSGRNTMNAVFGRILAWLLVAGCVVGMLTLWRRSQTNKVLDHASELRRLQSEHMLHRLRSEALQRQIEPHFLFNTLATIRRLRSSDPNKGRLLLSRFLAFLRGMIDDGEGQNAELADELAVASAYLDVCAMRMGGGFDWSIDVPETLHHLPFPRYGLTTLVENAVKHGIAPSRGGGTVIISGKIDGRFLSLCVADDGRGFTDTHGSGTGLANIREQLHLSYGPNATLALASNHPRGVKATIRIPAEVLP